MKPPPFRYERPESVEEALSLLSEEGDDAKVLAGGQSLVPLLAFRMVRPAVLIDIGRLLELESLALDGSTMVIGARVTHRAVERFPGIEDRCPVIREAVDQIGHVAIRNLGTVGGSLAHADPAAEWPLLALTLEAEFDLRSRAESRTLPAKDMFVGYMTTALRPDEMITAIRLELPKAGTAFVEIARRHGDFAMGGSAAVVVIRDGVVTTARIGLLAAAMTPVRSHESENILIGREPAEALLREAAEAVDSAIDPLGDVHASAEYKRHLAKVTALRALRVACRRAKEMA